MRSSASILISSVFWDVRQHRYVKHSRWGLPICPIFKVQVSKKKAAGSRAVLKMGPTGSPEMSVLK
jgi:hypothetical protein